MKIEMTITKKVVKTAVLHTNEFDVCDQDPFEIARMISDFKNDPLNYLEREISKDAIEESEELIDCSIRKVSDD